MSIYQEIWDADQSGSGVPAILPDAEGDPETGYVRVAAVVTGGPDLRVLPEVVIPPAKLRTYELVRALFDNYALPERDPETETPHEREEVHNLLSQIVDSAPMQVARRFVEVETGTVVTTDRWYSTLLEMWFRTFSQGGDPSLSGFEHVVVGEQEGAKVQGYHFWYKYFLDDGFAEVVGRENLPGFRSDQIVYVRGLYQNGQERFPESVTISYRWDAPDYERQTFRPLTKPVGGFFVGCSIEGLMALGTVRAHLGARAPKEAVINGARYDLKVFRSDNNKHLRTFYPVFLGEAGAAPQPPVVPEPEPILPQRQSPIRLIAALVNPLGDDPGQETVTLINTGPRPVSLEGWFLLDAMNNRYVLPSLPGPFPGGALTTITLPRNSIQLSNRGGEIRLLTNDGVVAHKVSYTRDQAAEQGRTLLF